jgi:multiple sugar transport system substrate-binding protein
MSDPSDLPTGRRGTRRAFVAAGVTSCAAVAAAACGVAGDQSIQKSKLQGTEVLWGTYLAPSDPRADMVKSAWRTVEQMTGLKITVIEETSGIIWDKRQTEFAAGTTAVDICYLTTAWVVPGGLRGMFVDLNPLAKRDKFDLSQYYKGAIDTWSWKGKLWALAFALGFEAVLYNKSHFLAKGVKLPTRDWTYDDFLAACQKLNDPANNRWAVDVGQNGLHYMMGTFVLNFGGKRLNDAKDKALWGDDPKSIQGAQLDVDLHTRYRYTPTPEARVTVPAGKFPMELSMVAMEFNGVFRHSNIRPAIGAENLDFAPPPKGPTGIQTTAVGGNSWAIMGLSKVKEAAWEALKANHSKEALLGPQIQSIAWPPTIWAANSSQWLDQFKGTRIVEAQEVAQKSPHDYMIVPEGQEMLDLANAPLNRALKGEISTMDAMRQSADAVNALFARRPPEWR